MAAFSSVRVCVSSIHAVHCTQTHATQTHGTTHTHASQAHIISCLCVPACLWVPATYGRLLVWQPPPPSGTIHTLHAAKGSYRRNNYDTRRQLVYILSHVKDCSEAPCPALLLRGTRRSHNANLRTHTHVHTRNAHPKHGMHHIAGHAMQPPCPYVFAVMPVKHYAQCTRGLGAT